jgi:hypothetical protein
MRRVADGIRRQNAHAADGIDDLRFSSGFDGSHEQILGAGHGP